MYANPNEKANLNVKENREVDIYNDPNCMFSTDIRYSYIPLLDD